MKSQENLVDPKKMPASQEMTVNEDDMASSDHQRQDEDSGIIDEVEDRNLDKIDIMADSPANHGKTTDVNGAFRTISSQMDSENIYETALNGSPKKQNSQSPSNRESHYGRN